MTRVGVIGATGYAGAELVRILAGHPQAEIAVLTSRSYAGVRFDTIYPALTGVVDNVCEDYDLDRVCDNTDVVFTALPHKLPMAMVPQLLARGKKIIDLSADFRFKDPSTYESHYQPHTAKDLLSTAVYGLAEVYRDRIKAASLVGNPGCYPTSILLPLVPLLKSGLLDPDSIIADSKSGVSGAGRSPSLTTLYCAVTESFKAYKVTAHRHTPEMEEILSDASGRPVTLTFTPHLVPMSRGMLSTIYAVPAGKVGADDVRKCLEAYYCESQFVRLRADAFPPDTLHVRGTNYCDIGFKLDARNNRLILMAAIDNLVKGAAGQAVQNMNLMIGLDETTGLLNSPYPL